MHQNFNLSCRRAVIQNGFPGAAYTALTLHKTFPTCRRHGARRARERVPDAPPPDSTHSLLSALLTAQNDQPHKQDCEYRANNANH